MSDEFTKGAFGQYDGMPEAGQKEPVLPELRLFRVTRHTPLLVDGQFKGVEEIFVSAHSIQYSGEVIIFQHIIFDRKIDRLVERTVRAFASWIDVEAVPMPAVNTLKH